MFQMKIEILAENVFEKKILGCFLQFSICMRVRVFYKAISPKLSGCFTRFGSEGVWRDDANDRRGARVSGRTSSYMRQRW